MAHKVALHSSDFNILNALSVFSPDGNRSAFNKGCILSKNSGIRLA